MTLIPKSIIDMHGIGVMEYKNSMTLIVKTSTSFPGFPGIFPGLPEFTRLSRNFPGYLRISLGFQVYPAAFESLRKGPRL